MYRRPSASQIGTPRRHNSWVCETLQSQVFTAPGSDAPVASTPRSWQPPDAAGARRERVTSAQRADSHFWREGEPRPAYRNRVESADSISRSRPPPESPRLVNTHTYDHAAGARTGTTGAPVLQQSKRATALPTPGPAALADLVAAKPAAPPAAAPPPPPPPPRASGAGAGTGATIRGERAPPGGVRGARRPP